MSMIKHIKEMVEHIPYPIGRLMALVPFAVRLGGECGRCRRLIASAADWSKEQYTDYVVRSFAAAFEHAKTFPCYRNLYAAVGVMDLHIKSIDDVSKVPTIDKAWTRQHFHEFKGAYRLNTGGSSGEPTAFWMDRNCWAREWAHMHTIWEKMGYHYTDLKLAIRGKNLGRRPFAYNPVHNEYIINTYLNVSSYAEQLKALFRKRTVRWFHGYPSSIHQFILECEKLFGKNATHDLFASVKGLLLSSEFPHLHIVAKFKEYNLSFVSWYGHSEMCILAYDDSAAKGGAFANCYHPFLTYGYCEVVNGHLIGTSFHNTDMPLIRYDTGDLVEALPGGAFAVREGRNGDFIVDKNGKWIPLTALIFGRHHHAFDVANSVQIGQTEAGSATLYVSGLNDSKLSIGELFDFTNIAVEFNLELIPQPIRTKLGKVQLRVV